MKRIIVLLLVLSLSFSLVSCGKSNDVTQNTGNNPIVVKGEGVFYGENAFEQYRTVAEE